MPKQPSGVETCQLRVGCRAAGIIKMKCKYSLGVIRRKEIGFQLARRLLRGVPAPRHFMKSAPRGVKCWPIKHGMVMSREKRPPNIMGGNGYFLAARAARKK